MAMFSNQQLAVFAVVGVVGVWYLQRKARQTAAKVVDAVNPVSQNNLANQAAEKTFTAVTGKEQPPGAAVYDWMKGDRDEWTMARTDEILWEWHHQGEPMDVPLAQGKARYEWNRDHAKWYKPGDRWSKSDLNGYQP